MKVYILEKVNIKRLYFYSIGGILCSILIAILTIFIIASLFPGFGFLEFLFIVLTLVLGNFVYKYAYRKSSTEIQIRLNNKKMTVGDDEIIIDNIKSIKIKRKFSYYPEIIFTLTDNSISMRVAKHSRDYYQLISAIKHNDNFSKLFEG